jgi:hypothetical protein
MAEDSALDDRTYRELAQRLLHHPHPDGPTSVDLFVGRLPDTQASQIPLPPDATLLGSALHSRSGRPFWMEAVLDGRAESTALLAGYESVLTASGWTPFENFGPMQGGFVSGEMGDGRAFRAGGQGPLLTVSVITRDGAPMDVRLRVDWEVLRHMPMHPHGMPPGADLLPPLRAPSGVTLRNQGGGGGGGRWSSEASVQTERPVAELESHFADQLAQAGWTRVAGSADDVVGWSSWRVPGDGGWRGLLLVVAPFGRTERSLTLRIDTHEPHDGESNAYSLTMG